MLHFKHRVANLLICLANDQCGDYTERLCVDAASKFCLSGLDLLKAEQLSQM